MVHSIGKCTRWAQEPALRFTSLSTPLPIVTTNHPLLPSLGFTIPIVHPRFVGCRRQHRCHRRRCCRCRRCRSRRPRRRRHCRWTVKGKTDRETVVRESSVKVSPSKKGSRDCWNTENLAQVPKRYFIKFQSYRSTIQCFFVSLVTFSSEPIVFLLYRNRFCIRFDPDQRSDFSNYCWILDFSEHDSLDFCHVANINVIAWPAQGKQIQDRLNRLD